MDSSADVFESRCVQDEKCSTGELVNVGDDSRCSLGESGVEDVEDCGENDRDCRAVRRPVTVTPPVIMDGTDIPCALERLPLSGETYCSLAAGFWLPENEYSICSTLGAMLSGVLANTPSFGRGNENNSVWSTVSCRFR